MIHHDLPSWNAGCPETPHKEPKVRLQGYGYSLFALIARVAWKYWFDSALRKLSVHSKYS